MAALAFLFVFMLSGVLIVRFMLPRLAFTARLWLGASLGILLMMWLPFLMGFIFDFTLKAHLLSLIPLALITCSAYFLRDKREARG